MICCSSGTTRVPNRGIAAIAQPSVNEKRKSSALQPDVPSASRQAFQPYAFPSCVTTLDSRIERAHEPMQDRAADAQVVREKRRPHVELRVGPAEQYAQLLR